MNRATECRPLQPNSAAGAGECGPCQQARYGVPFLWQRTRPGANEGSLRIAPRPCLIAARTMTN